MSKFALLPLLADGEFHSGQDIADVMGVSRTAVWKQINRLVNETGIAIESVKGKGYRVVGGIDLLHEVQINEGLDARSLALISRLEILDSVDSTNAEA